MSRKRTESIFITGGARSGKSRFARHLAGDFQRVSFLATAQARDPEMKARIERHRAKRNPLWETVEEPLELVSVLSGDGCAEAVLVDCITLWIANLMGLGLGDEAILEKGNQLAGLLREPARTVICVSNEVGSAIVPATPDGRRFRDLAGEMNQILAAACRRVYWLVSGIPVRIK